MHNSHAHTQRTHCSTDRYKLTVHTLDARGAGTHAPVSVVLVGEGGSSAEVLLERAGADTFGRGKVRPVCSVLVLRPVTGGSSICGWQLVTVSVPPGNNFSTLYTLHTTHVTHSLVTLTA